MSDYFFALSPKGQTYNRLRTLQTTLDSEIVYIGEDNEEIEMYVPTPDEKRILIKPCDHDVRVRSGIKAFLSTAHAKLQDFVSQEAPGMDTLIHQKESCCRSGQVL